jgi:DNA-binding NarL/FixJ family response regulator
MDDSVSTSELATSESTVAAGAERSWLLKQLKRLSPREQEILFLFGDGHTDQQISDILHSGPFKALKAKGVSSVRSRALDRLRQMMEDGHGKQ